MTILKTSIYDFNNMNTAPHMCTRSKIKITDSRHPLPKYFNIEHLQGYLKKDYILDWLTMKGDCLIRDKPNSFIKCIQNKKEDYVNTCHKYILEKFGGSCVEGNTIKERFCNTINFIKHKKKIICNGCIISNQSPIYCNIHLIVHSSVIPFIFNTSHVYSKIPQDMYVCVDFDYSILYMNQHKHILSKNNSRQHRIVLSQKQCMLNRILHQHNSNTISVIIPKKLYQKNKLLFRSKVFGLVNTHQFKYECKQWEKWINNLYDNIHEWSPTRNHKYILPNMSNYADYPWRTFKKQYSEYLQDITKLWCIGVKQRKICHNKGIYTWKKCNPYLLPIPQQYKKTVHKFIVINRQKSINMFTRMNNPSKIRPCKVEFYVDFETINSIGTTFQNRYRKQYIFLIGCYMVTHIDSDISHIDYTYFLTKDTSEKEERRIIQEWFEYMITNNKELFPTVYHWGHAEPSFLKHSLSLHHGIKKPFIHFIDICQIFRNDGLVVRNTWSFGLKEIAKAMYYFGYIETKWEEDMDGLQAMVYVWDLIENINENKLSCLGDSPIISNIIEYNRVDCIVLWEIIHYLRKMNPIGISNNKKCVK